MKKVIDCFTFYNELEILELRLKELYDVVDKFILVEAEKTHKGENKRFVFEENQWRFKQWMDKIVHVKVYYPSHINDAWGREKFQRNSFMPTLYSLGLADEDVVFITDVDEILNPERVNYIKSSYDLNGLFKMEMDVYFGSFYNKLVSPKWYHPKVVNWGTLKSKTPDECRLTFNCQWWERGGWHLTSFGGSDRIINKLENFSHQEFNTPEYKDKSRITESIKNGGDIFGSNNYITIDPENNPHLPTNWRIFENDEFFKTKITDLEYANSEKPKNYLAFYTVFIGSDKNPAFRIPDLPSEKYDCYYYTNNKSILEQLKDTSWIPVYIEVTETDDEIDSCMKAKDVKILTHKFKEISDYQYTCFLDSKLFKVSETTVQRLIYKFFILEDSAMALRRSTIVQEPDVYKELQESMKQPRYVTQAERYKKYIEDQKDNGFSTTTDDHFACGFIIRNMRHPKIKEINDTWYEHLEKCGIQDQISFFFAKQRFKEIIKPIDGNIFE
jgi:beta-1,4-mannosyl-glycoprotein beta-1,4-N-acetylglucosaminyltransferase